MLADGMADEPIEKFGGKTPVMAAFTPVMDEICRQSATGLVHTVPDGFHPGSEIANMNILGYHPLNIFREEGSSRRRLWDLILNRTNWFFVATWYP
ncbi:homoserine kinase [Geofilum rubicundum JCM 15548]|uniref:Homoserine kinase n=1 Tax=Geofilum rubicundum JCM 15548 TaxID=1236989 RepID=A0A0E9LVA0_9BACT|nr:homoserine kinase [Geofilum rubicundum JCM 15548]